MENWKLFFLKVIPFLLLGILGCTNESWYKKNVPDDKKKQLATAMLNGVSNYYQGTVAEQFLIEEAIKFDSTNADIWREFGTAQVKRGFAVKMEYFYGKATKFNPKEWQGWRGYLYLYFYRDFERAIIDFNAVDSILGLVGHSQGQNHDYMRGIAYYGLKDYSKALTYLNKYINTTIKDAGLDWVDVYAILYRGLTQEKLGNLENALADFTLVLKQYPKLADAHYHKARILYSIGENKLAISHLKLAKENFSLGYFHKRPYIEVLDQIYNQDIFDLEAKIMVSNQKSI